MDGLMIILFLIILFVIVVWLYIAKQGDAEFVFLVEQRTPWTVEEVTENSAVFSTKVPFVNRGTQGGTIMDAYPRYLLPCEQYDAVDVYARLTNMEETLFRTDGYWESVIVLAKEGGTVLVTVKLTAKEGSIEAALADMVNMPIDLVYQIVARSDWYLSKNRIIFVGDEARQAFQNKQNQA